MEDEGFLRYVIQKNVDLNTQQLDVFIHWEPMQSISWWDRSNMDVTTYHTVILAILSIMRSTWSLV